MINWLIDASLRNRFLVVVVCLLLGVWGYWALLTTPIDAIPDLSDNQVIVFTDWPGRPPQEVEDQVTYPLTVSLQGLPGVRVVRASSAFGFSIPPTPPKERNVPLAPSAESRRAKSLDIDLTVDGNGVKLGGRVSGNKGVSGAWLGVQVRGDGMTLDGRLQGNDGPPRDLKLNVGLLPGWARTAARIWLMLP